MARPKKEEKAPASTADLPNHISVEDFTRTRDAIVTGLTEIQRVVGDLLRGYIYHTNKLLGGDTMTMGLDTLPNNPFPTGAVVRAPSEAPGETTKSGKKKRPKKEVDPNAPKKPLTLFFYFAQNARQVVRNDLGISEDDTEQKGKVETEVLNRYHGLSEEEKTMWREAYQKDLEQWKIEMAEYQKKKAEASGAAAPEALPDVEIAEDDVAEGAPETEAEASSDDEDEDEEAPALMPPKAPTPPVEAKSAKTPKSSKRRKTAKENGLPVPVPAAVAASSPIPIPIPSSIVKPSAVPIPGEAAEPARKGNNKRESKEQSPEEPKKKKARKAKEPKEVKASVEVEPARETPAVAAPEKEKKPKKRTRKSDAAAAA